MNARALLLATLVISGCGKAKPAGQTAAATSTGSTTPDTSHSAPAMQQRLNEAAEIALPPGLPAESLPEPDSPGARLLVQYCTQCHALPSPSMHGPADWPSVARRMWVRIDMMAGALGIQTPSTAQRAELLDYLEKHALHVAATLPPGPGKAAFVEVCSRCHDLNDPRMHTPPDWPVVVMRMEKDAEIMKVRGITHGEAVQIISYLQAASAHPRPR